MKLLSLVDTKIFGDIKGLATAKYSHRKPKTIMPETKSGKKFMQSLDIKIYREIGRIARDRGISIQELIRATLIPTFLRGPIAFTSEQRKSFEKMRNGNGRNGRHRTRK